MYIGIESVVGYSVRKRRDRTMDRLLLLLRPTEAAEAIGVGRSKCYELIASGELPSIRIGGSVRVLVDALRAWIERKTAERAEGSRQ